MELTQRLIQIPLVESHHDLLSHLAEACANELLPNEYVVRFVVSGTTDTHYQCELGTLSGVPLELIPPHNIFDFNPRPFETAETFNVVMLIPTGVGADVGGHAGDGNPAARLLAASCDTLITHPNVVNASDINEMLDNTLYVEGSLITRLMMGTIGLRKVRANRVGLIMDADPSFELETVPVNAASAARSTLGVDIPWVIKMDPPIKTNAENTPSGLAAGHIEGMDRLITLVEKYRGQMDALAIASVIKMPKDAHKAYLAARGDLVNPWGGVEAMLTHTIASFFDIPTAHAPLMESMEMVNEITEVTDPRMAAEEISSAFLHCVFKGLQRAPRIEPNPQHWGAPDVFSHRDISCLVIPEGCLGLPVLAAMEQGIPVIAVNDKGVRATNDLSTLPFAPNQLIRVQNYLEAAGVLTALKSGLSLESIQRPLLDTRVIREHVGAASRHRANNATSKP